MKENILIFIDFIKKLYQRRYMIKTMALTNLKSRYVGSTFGYVWAVAEPIVQLLTWGVVFGLFLKSKPDPIFGTDNYFLYLLCGLVPWQFFSQTASSSTTLLTANGNLIKKAIGFPSEIFPLTNLASNIISHMIGLCLTVLIVVVFTGYIGIHIISIFIYLFFISLFCVGLGWITSSFYVYIKDTQQVMGLILNTWFFFTPIFYSPNIIPKAALPLFELNPMYHVVNGYRYALLAGKFLPFWDFAHLVIVSLLFFGVGGILFRRLKPGFAEVL